LEPVAVGGVAGSGTRVIAHLVRELGFYIGDELNGALDNLWFGFLLGRPNWYRANPAEVPVALSAFEKAMRGNPTFDATERAVVRGAVDGKGPQFEEPGLDPRATARRAEIAHSMERSQGPSADAPGWGWKLPDTHLFLGQLAVTFPGMKYVHVIREGVDLTNKEKSERQVRSWGSRFGLEMPADGRPVAASTVLDYWDAANRQALRLGPTLFGDRFLLLHYESVCSHPAATLATVSSFLGVRPDPTAVKEFSAFVRPPQHGTAERLEG
jgi:hypothetical protein